MSTIKWALATVFLIAMTADASSRYHSAVYAPQLYAYVDPSNELTLPDILNLPDDRFKKAPAAGYVGGYSHATHWLRFTLPADTSIGKPRILRIQPTYTDSLFLYEPNPLDTEDTFTLRKSGELEEDFNQKTDRAFTFELETYDQPRTFYIRLKSSNSSTLVATLHTPASYLQLIQLENVLSGMFFGLLLTLIVTNIGYRKWLIDKSFRYYLLFLMASLLVVLANNGWLTLYLPVSWQPWTAQLQQISTIVYLATLCLFYHSVFAFKRDKNPLNFWLSRGYLSLTGMTLCAYLLGFYLDAVPLLLNATLLYLTLISMVALKRTVTGDAEERLLFLGATLGFTGIIGTALSLKGILSGGVWLMYSYTLGTLTSIIVFQSIMSRRLRILEKQHVTTLLEKEHTQEQLARERADKEQKARFISMLSHELKTPLAILQMGLAQKAPTDVMRQHLSQAIKDMAMVIDRCAVLEKVDDQVTSSCKPIHYGELILEMIDNSIAADRIGYSDNSNTQILNSDPDWLKVILNNLLDNAIKYSKHNTKISIHSEVNDGRLCVEFTNITSSHLPEPSLLFEKYYRGNEAKSQTGSGLGLYIVKQLVQQLNGDIQCIPSIDPTTHEQKVTMRLCLSNLI